MSGRKKADAGKRSVEHGSSEAEVLETISAIFACCRTIAVYGMSSDPEAVAHRVPAYLASKGYNIIPINPHADELIGRKVYHRLMDVTENIEVVQVFRPSDQVPAVVREVLERKQKRGDINAVWLQLGIKSEEGKELAEKAGILFVEDRCMYQEHRRLFPGKQKV
jgi:predicted CoA-binding protein